VLKGVVERERRAFAKQRGDATDDVLTELEEREMSGRSAVPRTKKGAGAIVPARRPAIGVDGREGNALLVTRGWNGHAGPLVLISIGHPLG